VSLESFHARCAGNGTPDAADFIAWALTQPDAPPVDSPEFLTFLHAALDAAEKATT
jgi:hypothetical protein